MVKSRLEYNILIKELRMQQEDSLSGTSHLEAASWKTLDYRKLSTDEIIQSFKSLGIECTAASLKFNCEEHSEFEPWLEALNPGLKGEEFEKLWLLAFETWRRFYPEQQSFEQLCDDIDYVIFRYENLESCDEQIQDTLNHIYDLISHQSRSKKNAKTLFISLDDSCANSLECFIYDYICEQLDAHANQCASELLDYFEPLVEETRWFHFLRLRLKDGSQIHREFSQFLLEIKEKPSDCDIDLIFEIMEYFCSCNVVALFPKYYSFLIKKELSPEDQLELKSLVLQYLHDHEEDKIMQDLAVKHHIS